MRKGGWCTAFVRVLRLYEKGGVSGLVCLIRERGRLTVFDRGGFLPAWSYGPPPPPSCSSPAQRTTPSSSGPHHLTNRPPAPSFPHRGGLRRPLGIRVWEGRTGKVVTTLRGHVGAVHRLACSADSQLLTSASKGNTLKVCRPPFVELTELF